MRVSKVELMDQLTARLVRGEQAERLLDQLLDWAVANRQTANNRFVKCHTYHGEFPRVLVEALAFMGEPVAELKIAEGERWP